MAQDIAALIHSLLLRGNHTVSVAESCTGGILSSLLTRAPGSSRYFTLGLVVYSNKAKEDILKIPHSLIAKHGAVSGQVATLMALSVRKLAKADFAISITGIAGPGGAVPGKPVGTLFIAACSKTKKILRRFRFTGPRSAIRKKSALRALELLKKII